MDTFMNRLFPAVFTGIVGMVGFVLLGTDRTVTALMSKPVVIMGGVIAVANLISDYLWPSVRAEIHSIF